MNAPSGAINECSPKEENMKLNTQSFAGRLLRGTAVLVAAACAPALTAQEGGWSKWNNGLQFGFLKPMGNLADLQNQGFGIAWFSEKVFSNGFAVRGRLEATSFQGEEKKDEYLGAEYTYTENLSQFGAMLDLVYYHGLRDTIYPFVGIGYFSRRVDTEVTSGTFSGGEAATESTPLDSELAYCVGVGINLSRHWGVEAKYTVCEYNWAQFSLLFRF